jgi:uncharacterized protein YqiB (DUF1249 family)
MPPTRAAALALAVTTMTLSACGGSKSTLTSAQLIEKADAICQKANARHDKFKTSTNPIPYLPAMSANARREFAELSKLVAPSSMEEDWSTIVNGGETFAADLNEMAQDVKAGNTAAMRRVVPLAKEAQESVLSTAKNDNFAQCSVTSVHPN